MAWRAIHANIVYPFKCVKVIVQFLGLEREVDCDFSLGGLAQITHRRVSRGAYVRCCGWARACFIDMRC